MERKVISRTTIIKEVVEVKRNIYALKVPVDEVTTWKEDFESGDVQIAEYWDDEHLLVVSFNINHITHLANKYGISELMAFETTGKEVNYIEK